MSHVRIVPGSPLLLAWQSHFTALFEAAATAPSPFAARANINMHEWRAAISAKSATASMRSQIAVETQLANAWYDDVSRHAAQMVGFARSPDFTVMGTRTAPRDHNNFSPEVSLNLMEYGYQPPTQARLALVEIFRNGV